MKDDEVVVSGGKVLMMRTMNGREEMTQAAGKSFLVGLRQERCDNGQAAHFAD